MSRKLFLGIVNSIREFDSYFKCKKDCTGKLGFTSIQKCTTAMRMLAHGAPGDSLDDYGHMAESTTIECFYKFCRAVVKEICPRGNNKVVIYISLYCDKCLLFMLELY